jgi:hypothetical protein
VATIVSGTSLWLRAQAVNTRAIPSLLPPGALIYLEAQDFNRLLSDWNSSQEKKRWLRSANYQLMSFSRLVQRLSQAQGEFAEVAGIPVSINLVDQVAGMHSGFAFYNLSALSFVYITQMPEGRLQATALWRDRARYQSREVAHIPFYVKSNEGGARTVAFASYKEWFVVATDEDRMAATLVLLSGTQTASLATEPWFVAAEKQSAKQGHLRLIYNVIALLATPQFRTYWIQRNASELRPFSAGISDLFQSGDGFEEQRTLIRVSEAPARAESSLAEALAYAPANASLYRAWSMPETKQLTETLQQVVTGDRPPQNSYNAPAPMVMPEAGTVGSEADLEIRIDEPPFQRSSANVITPLVNASLAMRPTALLHVQQTAVLRDQVFVMPNSGAVIICKQPDRSAIDQALAQIEGLQRGDLDPLQVSANGNAVILSRLNLSAGAMASLGADVTYTAAYRHQTEWPNYKKLFAVIDTRAGSPEMAVSNNVPPFFSGNVQSLGDVWSRLRNASITTSDAGGEAIHETVRYEFGQP